MRRWWKLSLRAMAALTGLVATVMARAITIAHVRDVTCHQRSGSETSQGVLSVLERTVHVSEKDTAVTFLWIDLRMNLR